MQNKQRKKQKNKTDRGRKRVRELGREIKTKQITTNDHKNKPVATSNLKEDIFKF